MTLKVLLTGFAPFMDYKTNPSGNVVRNLNGQTIGGAEVIGRVLPVEHKVAASQLHEFIVTEEPDVVIGTGIFASRGCISLENVAVNRYFFRDTEKEDELDEALHEDGKEAYFSTLPLPAIKDVLQANGIPAEHSFTADTYVSNEVFYEIMRCAEKMNKNKAGFIHLPLSQSNVLDMAHVHYMHRLGIPNMKESTMEKAVRLIIEESVKLD
jgi:pyroglutamyl-peptidase